MTATVPSPASPPSRHEDGRAPGRVPVVLATSSPLVRGGLQIMLGNRPELRIVTGPPAPPARVAPTGRERHAPGAVLFDAGEPEAAYAEVVADARAARWTVLALAWPGEARRLLRGSAPSQPDGWLPKTAGVDEVAGALVRAARRGPALSGPCNTSPRTDDAGLSERECQMLVLIAAGLSNKEIAERCYLSINSVKTFIRAAYRKTGVRRRVEAVTWVHEQGLEGTSDSSHRAPPAA